MSTVLSPAERTKLIGILGLLSSDFDGERAAAGLLATKLLKKRGLTWGEVIGSTSQWELPPDIARAGQEAREGRAAGRGVSDDLRLCVRHAERLRVWEQGFIRSVAIRPKRSPKQNSVIREIAAGLRARGFA